MIEYADIRLEHMDGVYQADHDVFPGEPEQLSMNSVVKYCTSGRGVVAVDRDLRMVVGFVLLKDDKDLGECCISSLGVAESHRRLGIGRTLLNMGVARAGTDRVHLHVRASNHAAQSLYESAGFRMAEVLDEYYENREAGILMRLEASGSPP